MILLLSGLRDNFQLTLYKHFQLTHLDEKRSFNISLNYFNNNIDNLNT